ncbi:MAG: class I SAM-dependent methyltransferase [Sciscionella sp.]
MLDLDWDHNAYYYRLLLRQLPQPCRRALDVGCGAGSFAAQLAHHAEHVDALDRSAEMIDAASKRAPANVSCILADALVDPLPDSAYDAIFSISVLHHMPLQDALPRFAAALRPGGTLAVAAARRIIRVGDRAASRAARLGRDPARARTSRLLLRPACRAGVGVRVDRTFPRLAHRATQSTRPTARIRRSPGRRIGHLRAAYRVVSHEVLRRGRCGVALRKCPWWVPDFSTENYWGTLARLNEQMRGGEPVVAYSTRHLIEARRPAAR